MNRRAAILAALALLLAAEPASAAGREQRKRLRLELSVGLQALAPAELNLAAEADERLQYLLYDRHLDYLRSSGQIRSWSATAAGRRARVGSGVLLEPCLTWEVSSAVSLSAGLRLLDGGRAAELAYAYTRVLPDGGRYVETLAYSPYLLRVTGWWPSLGVRWGRRLGRALRLEGYAQAGPLLARVSYRSAWTYAWDMTGENYSWPVFRDAGERKEKGAGTGAGLEGGGRLAWALGPRLSLFLAGGYSRQRVDALSGSGRETRAGSEESWSGTWVLRGETVATPWETMAVRYPTCRPQAGADDDPFRLDLSGWRLSAGLSWRL
jgi:hypothetical protein